ncbi:DUF2335 domain-containing protein [Lacticaseibacillus chiayiensis]|uniref:DUF2335 domain-containing protein n=1 Tax=Lacticaseibacillus chiayiensis TaxID=2100821 RepID=UPI001BCCBA90|nr:DUF2335 domain-containing protein [Lacticaseibacillus chiayiensis]QVI33958.1 DUF2335 domain-containing protein [Lacticaseibacillus chiayiensis]
MGERPEGRQSEAEKEEQAKQEIRNTIKRIPKDRQKSLLRSITSSHYQGPIPPADMMAQYERILPGSADRILGMTEKKLDYQIRMQEKQLEKAYQDSHLGLWFGFVIAIICIISGTLIALFTSTGVGVAVIFGSLATLAGIFVYGSRGEKSSEKKHQSRNELHHGRSYNRDSTNTEDNSETEEDRHNESE